MKPLRPEEEWARQMVQAASGLQVDQHDDGTRPGMHDLAMRLSDGMAAIEVVAAADAEAIELWNLVNGSGRLICPDLAGGWMVVLDVFARADRLRSELPAFLRTLEAQGVTFLHEGATVNDEYARALGITRLHQSATDFPGSVYFTLELGFERSGGVVADHSNAVAAWIGDWLNEPSRRDVLEKLARAEARERHAFILVPGFATASFAVTDPLMRDGASPPTDTPQLPAAVTHVWIASTWSSGSGFRWSPENGWELFDKLQHDGLSPPLART